MESHIFVIAEAGVNHNGELETAQRLIDAAAEAGADAVKFQTFKAEKLVTPDASKAGYQMQSTDTAESQLQMLRKLELKYEFHLELRDYCRQKGVEFMSTAFDLDSLTFLLNEVGINKLKIPSGEITNGPFLLAHAETGKDIILSTGMASPDEIELALGVLAFGYLNGSEPGIESFKKAYRSALGQKILKEKVIMLHCTSEYPTPMQHVHLRAMNTLQDTFDLPVGYSDHTEGVIVPIAAAARGAVVIEKHFTLDRGMQGPDHQVSLEPAELKQMIDSIRAVEQALGQPQKEPQPVELKNRAVVRKSLVAATKISAGDTFSAENLTLKRPGTGLSPMEYWHLLGTTSQRNYQVDDLIE